jgi:hypothetical protein
MALHVVLPARDEVTQELLVQYDSRTRGRNICRNIEQAIGAERRDMPCVCTPLSSEAARSEATHFEIRGFCQ